MLMPKRVKHRKVMRGRMKGAASRGTTVVFGEYGIQAPRRAITNAIRRGGKVWIRIFPDKPVTQKPAETRMGSGKGNPEFWVAVVKPGRILFELGGVREDLAEEALTRAIHKLPMKCRIVKRETAGTAVAEETAEV